MPIEKYLSSPQVCELLGVHLKTLQRYCREGRINFIKLGGIYSRHRYRESAVAEFLARQMVATASNRKKRPTPNKKTNVTAVQQAGA